MPRRLTAPDPQLQDDLIRLEPLDLAHLTELLELAEDPDVVRFTRVPADAGETFARGWIRRYQGGWQDGTSAGFAIRVCWKRCGRCRVTCSCRRS